MIEKEKKDNAIVFQKEKDNNFKDINLEIFINKKNIQLSNQRNFLMVQSKK